MEQEPTFPKQSTAGDKHTATYENATYDVYRLLHYAETLPVHTAPLSRFTSQLDDACWTDTNGGRVRPRDVLEVLQKNPNAARTHRAWQEHIQKIKQVDTGRPLLVVGTSYVMDGMHRLVKLVLDGVEKVSFKQFDTLPESARVEKE